MGDNNTNAFFQGGQRFSNTPINLTLEQLDEKAREAGYPDFASFQESDPAGAQAVLAAAGMASPEDSGQVQTQVAQHDDLSKWIQAARYLPLVLAGGYGAAGLAGLAGAGGAGAASAAAAPTSLAASGVPIATGVLPAALPGAVGLGTTGASSATGLAGLLGSGAGTSTAGATSAAVTPQTLTQMGLVKPLASGATKGAGGFLGSIGKGGATDFALKTGTGIASSILQNNQNNKQLELQREQLAQQQRQFDTQMGQRQGEQASAATQLNPFTQAQARQKQALLASLLGGYTPTTFSGGKISGGAGNYNASTFAPAAALMTPEAMQANEEQFTQNQQGATGGRYQGPDYNRVGYGALANLLSNLKR